MNEVVEFIAVGAGIIVILWLAYHFMEWAMDDNSFFDGGDITDEELNDEHRTEK